MLHSPALMIFLPGGVSGYIIVCQYNHLHTRLKRTQAWGKHRTLYIINNNGPVRQFVAINTTAFLTFLGHDPYSSKL